MGNGINLRWSRLKLLIPIYTSCFCVLNKWGGFCLMCHKQEHLCATTHLFVQGQISGRRVKDTILSYPPLSHTSMSLHSTLRMRMGFLWFSVINPVVERVYLCHRYRLTSTVCLSLLCSRGGSERTVFRRPGRQGLLLQSRQVSSFGSWRTGLMLPFETTPTTNVYINFFYIYFLKSSKMSDDPALRLLLLFPDDMILR